MDLKKRLALDVERIRQTDDRTGKLAERQFRWEGSSNPNGWRVMADLANDIEEALKLIPD